MAKPILDIVTKPYIIPIYQRNYNWGFDEITQLMQAQRDAAWGEVARRLAHEIKNPLTPIQLSAERLQMKLADKLSEQDNHILRRATQTIINQVAALKNMVDAFSQYARSPQLKLQPLQLNRLYETSRAKISLNLAVDLPFIQGDATLLRQVVHNLLQNAQDALLEQENPIVELITQIDQQRVQLTVSDNGTGFAEQLLKQAFEPYVTTKAKGTGLGLAIVKKIVEEHGGNIQIQNREPHGARVTLHFPVSLTKQG
jgi:nitrogen fixation/metabolism regulation signal transduction histidine kinase